MLKSYADIERRWNENRKKKKSANADDINAPLILIVTGYLSMTDEGMMKLRVKEIDTLESIARAKGPASTLNFTSKLF